MADLQAGARALAPLARQGRWQEFYKGFCGLVKEHGPEAADLAVEVAIALDQESRAMHEKGWWE